MYILICKFDFN